jgi:hypothetical protein
VIRVDAANTLGAAVTSFRSQKNYDGSKYTFNLNYARPSWRYTDYPGRVGGGSWAWADVNALQAGVEITGAAGYALASCFEVKAIISCIASDGAIREITLRPNSDVSGSPTDNGNTSMAFTYLDGDADSNNYATISSTTYKGLLSAILPIEHEIRSISEVRIRYSAKRHASLTTGNAKGILRTHGTESFGTEQTLTTSSVEYVDTWTTNPVTSLPWTAEEIQTLNFGVVGKGNSASYAVYFYAPVQIEIDCVIEKPGLALIPAQRKRLAKHPQNPVQANELEFTVQKDVPLPDYAEIVLVDRGLHVFHGMVTSKSDLKIFWHVKCKSMEWQFDWRYIPAFIFASDYRNMGRWSGTNTNQSYHYPPQSDMDLEGFFSSSPPRWCDFSAYYDANNIQCYCAPGLLFQAHSIIPNGKWEAYSATVAKLPGGGRQSCLGDRPLYACTTFPRSGYGAVVVDNAYIDGIKKLRPAVSLAGIGNNEYWRTDTDLYVKFGDGSYPPNGFLVYAWNWCDTKIRRGTIERANWRFGTDFPLEGGAAKAIDEIAQNAAQEIQFLPNNDGYLYMNMATEIGRGSISSPIKNWVHNQNNVSVRVVSGREPKLQAIIGANSTYEPTAVNQIATNWDFRDPQLFKIVNKDAMTKDQMQVYLDTVLAQQEVSIEVTAPEDLHLLIGDHVRITPENAGPIDLRVAQVAYGQAGGPMIVTCGRFIEPLSQRWGNYLRASIEDNMNPIQESELDFAAEYDSFIITKESAAKDNGLRVFYEEDFQGPEDDTTNAMGAFIVLEVNDIIIPPGRILVVKGSIKIDITDYCTISTAADSTNTMSRNLFLCSGWTSESAKVRQFSAKIQLIEEI